MVIDSEFHVLQFRGPTGAYLEPPTGKASFDILRMARQGLMLPLRAAINKSTKENKIVFKENVRVAENGGFRTVNLRDSAKNLQEHCSLILFEETKSQAAMSPPRRPGPIQKQGGTGRFARSVNPRNAELERELAERGTSRIHPGAARSRRHGTPGFQRRNTVGQRGIPKPQRRTGDVQGRTRINERRVDYAQRRDGQPQR